MSTINKNIDYKKDNICYILELMEKEISVW